MVVNAPGIYDATSDFSSSDIEYEPYENSGSNYQSSN